ncbi:GNAT family N-acetyltransferase [Actinoplanes sp. HUAS TT8]|uniref:GNAT family N-acetyltransferase n=1 Tax=Actinoplanes sp. HUAS TT8 TaxID=3447453 RepID=UPI003F526112
MVTVRRFRGSDTGVLWALGALPNVGETADPTVAVPLSPAVGVPSGFPDLADVEGAFLAVGGEFLVVELDGHLVGMGGFRPGGDGRAEVLRVRVHPATRRRGVGRALMAELERRAVAAGLRALHLDTATNQPEAMAFYEALGFVEVGREHQPGWSWTLAFYVKALTGVDEAYDVAAPAYAELFRDSLRDSPLDRAILGAFADVVKGEVADVGCGPGHVTAYLAGLGVAVFGVDASPAMIGLARQAYPVLRFEVGSMAALNVADGALGGVLSRWSIIHTPPPEVPAVLAEFRRVLAPGGHLLIGFSAGGHPTQAYDHRVAPAYLWQPDHLAGLLRECGLAEVARLVCEPERSDPRQYKGVQLLARRA